MIYILNRVDRKSFWSERSLRNLKRILLRIYLHCERSTSGIMHWPKQNLKLSMQHVCNTSIYRVSLPFPHSTKYFRKISGIYHIFHCNLNIVVIFLSNTTKYFITTLQFQLSEIFLKTNEYLILLEILYKHFVEMCRSYTLQ